LVLAGTLVSITWVVALRRRVSQQTNLLRESEERFRHLALHDNLTGLATRLLLNDRLSVALISAGRHLNGLAVLIVDVDHFKGINDTYGHPTGDVVLRITAERLQRAVRREDTVARLGGDEFVVLLPDLTDPNAAGRIAAILVSTLAVPIAVDGREVPLTVSVGVCSIMAGELDADGLLRNADAALYRAKAGGRNRFEIFRPEMKYSASLSADSGTSAS
jgi:diguanylate cyclase (GGDEF)-like protein